MPGKADHSTVRERIPYVAASERRALVGYFLERHEARIRPLLPRLRPVGIGRHDEARRYYSSDVFKAASNDSPEWRTIHLGIDLFLESRSALSAPLDGVVHSITNNSGRPDRAHQPHCRERRLAAPPPFPDRPRPPGKEGRFSGRRSPQSEGCLAEPQSRPSPCFENPRRSIRFQNKASGEDRGHSLRFPPGYLREGFRHARSAGAFCFADEVQVGF